MPPACLFTGLCNRALHIGDQHRFIDGEGFRIRIAGRADHANNGGGYGGNDAGAVVNLQHLHAVMIVTHPFNSVVNG